ncbi:hypothetical protein EYF80_053929 [Liparis tanakae]|uniref:Uncharacterized protein n=1 Tax=Liparis tanakae TaxID=230148 RepID=A0A4Z2F435_9TELE|nr:hypothetical protein EYF80_053929 [Liparis tanakae]
MACIPFFWSTKHLNRTRLQKLLEAMQLTARCSVSLHSTQGFPVNTHQAAARRSSFATMAMSYNYITMKPDEKNHEVTPTSDAAARPLTLQVQQTTELSVFWPRTQHGQHPGSANGCDPCPFASPSSPLHVRLNGVTSAEESPQTSGW